MAETKTKVNGTSNGNHNHNHHNGGSSPADKSPASAKASKLRQLLALAKEVTKDDEAVRDYEQSVEGRRALEQELEAKTGEAQRLRAFNDKVVREFSEYKTQASAKTETLFAEFEQKYKKYESNKGAVEAMEHEVVEMREKLAEAEEGQRGSEAEVEKLRTEVRVAEVNVRDHAAEIKDMNAECEIHRSRMQTSIAERDACMAILARAQADLGEGVLHSYTTEDLKRLGVSLQALSKSVHDFVMDYFNDLEGPEDATSEIQDLKKRFPNIPLSAAQSRSAALMRCAVAEAVIADVLRAQIFVPFYLAPELKAAAALMLRFFGGDERRSTVYRCQMLSNSASATAGKEADGDGGNSEETARVHEDIIRKASHEVRGMLLPLVAVFKQAGFHKAVPLLFREALALWAEVQRARDAVAVERLDGAGEAAPGRYPDYDMGVGGKAGGGAAVAMELFPRVATRDDIIFNGMALWTNQGALVAAASAGAGGQESNGVNGHGQGHGRSNGVGGAGGEPAKPPVARRKSVVSPESPLRSK